MDDSWQFWQLSPGRSCQNCHCTSVPGQKTVPSLWEFCSCCCLPLLPGLAWKILATWEPFFCQALYMSPIRMGQTGHSIRSKIPKILQTSYVHAPLSCRIKFELQHQDFGWMRTFLGQHHEKQAENIYLHSLIFCSYTSARKHGLYQLSPCTYIEHIKHDSETKKFNFFFPALKWGWTDTY